ncbi:DUF2017 domain-containing protein [Microbacterium sp. zg.Y1090]|uniref:DUF2017 domain-containing protein n=1 Tax=Microbacterium wangruii TaxID=3049073 RepID=UPI00214D14CB|nr:MULTISPECIES: DUF2017 domain-containing protein [unclassified Microbacterium]MCR2818889.1 DUF2017 domain-containing protein [Microbacterium sp. zg.Y1090]WIM27201.1 DUF2017 domain-containing protein [Microbacterium sp. zg-Y1090]
MTGAPRVTLELTMIEGAHLADLVSQLLELLDDGFAHSGDLDDPALARLVPDAYRDDPDAAREFRELTASDLLGRRRDDARAVLQHLSSAGVPLDTDGVSPGALTDTVGLPLSADGVRAWLRILNALRLVLASRLGIDVVDDHDADDPRYAIYDWLGYRLDVLVTSLAD